jgi:hypothetical protein
VEYRRVRVSQTHDRPPVIEPQRRPGRRRHVVDVMLTALVVEHECDHHVDLVVHNLAAVTAHVLLFDPGAADVAALLVTESVDLTSTERSTDHSSDIVERRAVPIRIERPAQHIEKTSGPSCCE